MAQNISLWGASYPDVPAVNLPKTGGGTARFTDVTDTTADASDVATGKVFFASDGTQTIGTRSGGGGTQNVWYGTSDTAASTQTKVVTLLGSGFVLEEGVIIVVEFLTTQSYNGQPKLNVNDTGAVNVMLRESAVGVRYMWQTGEVCVFVYDGTNWVVVEGGIASTTSYGVTKLSSSTTSTSTSLAATASAVKAVNDRLTYGSTDLTPGTSELTTGVIYVYYE